MIGSRGHSRFLNHEACPKCGSKDNLGVWDDGHKYCFGCGYYLRGSAPLPWISSATNVASTHEPQNRNREYFDYPRDSSEVIGEVGRLWLNSYGIYLPEIAKYGILWSEFAQQLVFPFSKQTEFHTTRSSIGSTSIGWIARNFRKDRAKWFLKVHPSHKDTLVVLLPGKEHVSGLSSNPRTLVLVEDLVSAIRVAEAGIDCIPLLGCHLHPQHKDAIVRYPAERVFSWLDSNKWDVSVGISRSLSMLGKTSHAIYTSKDPKCYRERELHRIIDDAHASVGSGGLSH